MVGTMVSTRDSTGSTGSGEQDAALVRPRVGVTVCGGAGLAPVEAYLAFAARGYRARLQTTDEALAVLPDATAVLVVCEGGEPDWALAKLLALYREARRMVIVVAPGPRDAWGRHPSALLRQHATAIFTTALEAVDWLDDWYIATSRGDIVRAGGEHGADETHGA